MKDNNNYCVYTHKVVTDDRGPMWYVGVTKNVKNRWKPHLYKGVSLWPYIERYGWENIEHRVIAEGIDKETAQKLEGCLINMYLSADCCINKNKSGVFELKDHNEYSKQYYKSHREERKVYQRAYGKAKRSTPQGKIYYRVYSFNRLHPDRAIETPREARDKYLEIGYIPDYIKNDDLC